MADANANANNIDNDKDNNNDSYFIGKDSSLSLPFPVPLKLESHPYEISPSTSTSVSIPITTPNFLCYPESVSVSAPRNGNFVGNQSESLEIKTSQFCKTKSCLEYLIEEDKDKDNDKEETNIPSSFSSSAPLPFHSMIMNTDASKTPKSKNVNPNPNMVQPQAALTPLQNIGYVVFTSPPQNPNPNPNPTLGLGLHKQESTKEILKESIEETPCQFTNKVSPSIPQDTNNTPPIQIQGQQLQEQTCSIPIFAMFLDNTLALTSSPSPSPWNGNNNYNTKASNITQPILFPSPMNSRFRLHKYNSSASASFTMSFPNSNYNNGIQAPTPTPTPGSIPVAYLYSHLPLSPPPLQNEKTLSVINSVQRPGFNSSRGRNNNGNDKDSNDDYTPNAEFYSSDGDDDDDDDDENICDCIDCRSLRKKQSQSQSQDSKWNSEKYSSASDYDYHSTDTEADAEDSDNGKMFYDCKTKIHCGTDCNYKHCLCTKLSSDSDSEHDNHEVISGSCFHETEKLEGKSNTSKNSNKNCNLSDNGRKKQLKRHFVDSNYTTVGDCKREKLSLPYQSLFSSSFNDKVKTKINKSNSDIKKRDNEMQIQDFGNDNFITVQSENKILGKGESNEYSSIPLGNTNAGDGADADVEMKDVEQIEIKTEWIKDTKLFSGSGSGSEGDGESEKDNEENDNDSETDDDEDDNDDADANVDADDEKDTEDDKVKVKDKDKDSKGNDNYGNNISLTILVKVKNASESEDEEDKEKGKEGKSTATVPAVTRVSASVSSSSSSGAGSIPIPLTVLPPAQQEAQSQSQDNRNGESVGEKDEQKASTVSQGIKPNSNSKNASANANDVKVSEHRILVVGGINELSSSFSTSTPSSPVDDPLLMAIRQALGVVGAGNDNDGHGHGDDGDQDEEEEADFEEEYEPIDEDEDNENEQDDDEDEQEAGDSQAISDSDDYRGCLALVENLVLSYGKISSLSEKLNVSLVGDFSHVVIGGFLVSASYITRESRKAGYGLGFYLDDLDPNSFLLQIQDGILRVGGKRDGINLVLRIEIGAPVRIEDMNVVHNTATNVIWIEVFF